MANVDMTNPAHLERMCKLYNITSVKASHAFYTAIFNNLNVRLQYGLARQSKSKGGLRQFLWKRWLFIEQNPENNSKYGKMARAGAKIMWVIDVEATTNAYCAVVINGKLRKL